MERIAQDGFWLTKKPANPKQRTFFTRLTGDEQSLAEFEMVTDQYKENYEQWLAAEKKKLADSEEE
jgi:hypothetical protein